MTQPPQDPYRQGGFPPPPTPGHSAPGPGYPAPGYPPAGYPPAGYPPVGYPGPQRYAAPPGYPPQFQGAPLIPRPTRGLGVWAIVAACLVAAAEIGQAVAAYLTEDEYLRELVRGGSTVDVYTAYDGLTGAAVLPLIGAYVLGCLWLQRLRSNARYLEPYRPQALADGWVWGGWVVPVVNFWFPLWIVLDSSRDPRTGRSPVGLLATWWAAWIIASLTTVAGAVVLASDEIDAVRQVDVVESVHAGLVVVALALWAVVIVRLTGAQERALGVRR